jgi:pyruvate dehydrogenase E2 component (dihydrolipoamide acetyltransferase)
MVETIRIPDIGGGSGIKVIEILVKEGDDIAKEQSLITLESEKASMEIPAPMAGKVGQLMLKVGDTVQEGDSILTMQPDNASAQPAAAPAVASTSAPAPAPAPASVASQPQLSKEITYTPAATSENLTADELIHAGPATRRLARELGVDLGVIRGSGPKGRVLTEDIHQYVKTALASAKSGGGSGLPAQPSVDFSKYGQTEAQPLSRIKKISGANLHRNWVLVPHITQFGEADITEMEAFRVTQKDVAEKQGVKMTPLVFMMKAVVASLKRFPEFNASLDASMANLILKKYFHIGVAVDTPNGLVVAVIRNVDQKGLLELAKELAEVSQRARTKGLMPADMEGSCFTISSLGGIGGTAFTPIVNVPDVAILGVSKAQMKPVYQDGGFVPRLILPLSLSYDHRVIDGAQGARFMQYLTDLLGDIRSLLL